MLADERLVTIGDGEVEVAHEALLREWPRLRAWLEQDADARRLQQHLIHAARTWHLGGRDSAELYRGARLAAALDWSAEHEDELNTREREFLTSSQAHAEVESVRQRRANRRLRLLLGGATVLLAVAILAGAIAVGERGNARRAAQTADAQRLGAEALTRDRLDQAMLLARAGVALEDTPATRGQMLTLLMRNPQVLGTLPGDGAPLFSLVVSPDGKLIALAGSTGSVMIIDAISRRPVGQPYRLSAGPVLDLQFSPDSRTLAVAGDTRPGPRSGGFVDMVDAATHRRRLRITLPPFPEPAQWLGVHVLFEPNGRDVLVQQVHQPIDPSGPPSVLRRFDGMTGRVAGRPVRLGRHASVLMWSTADRRRVFVTSAEDDVTYMIDAERLHVIGRWPVGDFAGTVSADGTRFALGSQEGDVRVLDLKSGHVRTFGRHDASVLRMRFTAAGRTLVTSGADGTVIVWDVARGAAHEMLSGHARGLVWGMAVSPDGRTAYSVGEDQRAFVWDLTGDQSLVRPFAAERPFDLGADQELFPRGLAVSPDGRTLAVGHSDGTVDLLDARTLTRRHRVRALRGFVGAVAFSPNGHLIAVTGQRGELTLWDARSLRPVGRLEGQHNLSQALAFSPNGALLAAGELGVNSPDREVSERGTVRVWDVRRRTQARVRFAADSPSIAFSPNGRLLAAAGIERPTEVRDPRNGRLIVRLPTPGDGRSVAFSPDGRLMATGHYDGTAQLWSTTTWKPVGKPFTAHDGQRVLWMGFTAGASMLATAGQDGTAALFDVATHSPIGQRLTVEPDSYLAAALAPDGQTLFVVSDQRAALRWNLSPDAWKRHACRIAGRELTALEWVDALPREPYREICRAR